MFREFYFEITPLFDNIITVTGRCTYNKYQNKRFNWSGCFHTLGVQLCGLLFNGNLYFADPVTVHFKDNKFKIADYHYIINRGYIACLFQY